MKKKAPYVYCICRVDTKTWKKINHSIQERGYSEIKCFVPSVQVLSKSKDKKNLYKDIPMLFNYGFIKMRANRAFDRSFLRKLTKEVDGLIGFLKSLDYMHPKKLRKRIDNAEDWDDFSKVATVSRDEFKYYMKLAKQNHIYSFNEVAAKVNDMIVLKRYPFDGLMAKILDFNFANKTAQVEIYPGNGSVLKLQLPLDNLMYSVYDDYDENNLLVDSSSCDVNLLSDDETPLDEQIEIEL